MYSANFYNNDLGVLAPANTQLDSYSEGVHYNNTNAVVCDGCFRVYAYGYFMENSGSNGCAAVFVSGGVTTDIQAVMANNSSPVDGGAVCIEQTAGVYIHGSAFEVSSVRV